MEVTTDRILRLQIVGDFSNEPRMKLLKSEFGHLGHYVATCDVEDVASDPGKGFDAYIIVTDDAKCIDNLPIEDGFRRPIVCLITSSSIPPRTSKVDICLPDVPIAFIEREILRAVMQRDKMATADRHRNEVELLKSAIVRNVSHELKTPLLQAKAAVALMVEGTDREDTLSEMAVTAIARLEDIVKNITLLAESMNGNFGPIQVRDSVHQVMRGIRRSWLHNKDYERVELFIEPDLPPALADKQGLSVALSQLIDNALKFSKEDGGPVEVHVRLVHDGIEFVVRDYGIGIEPDNVSQIFDSFYQVDSSTTRRYGGTGVGLTVVRLIMEKHDIPIHIESKPGKGSTFSFVMPLANL